jgi:hypothetical protein
MKPIAYEESALRRLDSEAWTFNGDKAEALRGLATLGERLRKRYENACSYQWATTEAYEAGTDRLESRLKEECQRLGLKLYIQGDCRGATVYVCGPAGEMTPSNYSTFGTCLYRK